MSSAVGPCYEKGWKCHETHLSCYKDCCKRGVQFCNHKEKRCGKCEDRKSQCNNYTMPPECDGFCITKNRIANSSECVDPVYKYATFCLGPVVLILLVLQVRQYYLKRKQRHHQQQEDESDKVSVDGTTGSSMEDKEADLQDDETKVKISDAELAAQLSTQSHNPASLQRNPSRQSMPLFVTNEQPLGRETPSSLVSSRSSTSTPTGPITDAENEPLIAPSSYQEQSVISSHLPACPSHGEQIPQQPEPHRYCRDHRLDNICPTTDSDFENVNQVHTSHSP